MANAECGSVVIGVHDDRVEGVDGHPQHMNELRQSSVRHTDPPVRTCTDMLRCITRQSPSTIRTPRPSPMQRWRSPDLDEPAERSRDDRRGKPRGRPSVRRRSHGEPRHRSPRDRRCGHGAETCSLAGCGCSTSEQGSGSDAAHTAATRWSCSHACDAPVRVRSSVLLMRVRPEMPPRVRGWVRSSVVRVLVSASRVHLRSGPTGPGRRRGSAAPRASRLNAGSRRPSG